MQRSRSALAGLILLPGPAIAHGPVSSATLRIGVHRGFVRIVLDTAQPQAVEFLRDQTGFRLRVPAGTSLTAADAKLPPEFGSLAVNGTAIQITLAKGAHIHSFRLPGRVAFDIRDAEKTPHPSLGQNSGGIQNSPLRRAELAHLESQPSKIALLPPAVLPSPLPTPPVPAPVAPDPPADTSQAIALPFPEATGAALLQRGSQDLIIFDQLPIGDLAPALASLAPAAITVHRLAHATEITLTPPAGKAPILTRQDAIWSLSLGPASAASAPHLAGLRIEPGELTVNSGGDGRTVMIPDPATGNLLEIGTRPAPDTRIDTPRHFAQFTLLPTQIGVAVDPLSDSIILAPRPTGFTIGTDGPVPLALTPNPVAQQAMADQPVTLSRYFDLPDDSTSALAQNLRIRLADAASSASATRGRYRRRVAEAMLALGLGDEAEGVLRLTAEDDPRALADPKCNALFGAAAVLAHRPAEATALLNQDLPANDEIRLWRALRLAALRRTDDPVSADLSREIARDSLLLLGYAKPLRDQLIPLAARTELAAGNAPAAAMLLAIDPHAPRLAFDRAEFMLLNGAWRDALAAFDRTAAGPDRSQAAQARLAALELRVSHGLITPRAAAEAADAALDDWRGDRHERDLRLHLATWRGQAGQYRQQLEALRAALIAFPDPADGVRAALDVAWQGIVEKLRQPDAGELTPFDLVALIKENHDLLPTGPAARDIGLLLADRLEALDLADSAVQILQQLLDTTTDPDARASIGERLAKLLEQTGHHAEALASLAATQPTALSQPDPGLMSARTITKAKAEANSGDPASALALLAPVGTAGLLSRATIAEQNHEWQNAAHALSDYLASISASGPLPETDATALLRLASDDAELGDEPALAKLRARFATRFDRADDAALFDLLTGPPVRALSDLPRAERESTIASQLPQTLAHTTGP